MNLFSIFIQYNNGESIQTLNEFEKNWRRSAPFLVHPGQINIDRKNAFAAEYFSTDFLKLCIEKTQTPYCIFFLKNGKTIPIENSEKQLSELVKDQPTLLYANYFKNNTPTPVIPYQKGSIREDFDFGAAMIIKTEAIKTYLKQEENSYHIAGLYRLWLFLSTQSDFTHINEPLFRFEELDRRDSSQKMFDYVDPKNRENQIEFEQAATDHLKATRALAPIPKPVDLKSNFEYEASIIIPVRNRVKTISDAIHSAMKQKTNFPFNIIVIDNHSSDGTTEIISKLAEQNPNLIHYIPTSNDLGIGGCWNEAVEHEKCGKFAVQLDSDDLYINENTLQTIVDKFYANQCAMVIGSYSMVDFNLQPIPPGLIDHREWTEDNGANNALRINGFGAPRAFYTPIIREVKFPNVSYGEDYAVCLAISRNYPVGRIYDSLYLCRRWEDNTDSNIDIEQLNKNNFFKDSLRTKEIEIRSKLNNPS